MAYTHSCFPKDMKVYTENLKPEILNPINFLKHLSSIKLSSAEDLISWRSGRRISLDNKIKTLKQPIQGEHEDALNTKKNILVLDSKNQIAGIAIFDDDFVIRPKVVFDAIG